MIPETIGKNYYPNKKIPLLYLENDNLAYLKEKRNYLSIVYIQKGNGSYKIGNKSFFFTSPIIFCINEKECIDLFQYENIDVKILTFFPNYINDLITFDIIYKEDPAFNERIEQDLWLAKQLFYSKKEPFLQKKIGTITEKKINWLFNKIKMEYIDQNDEFWPCRGKSYFFELLFLLERSQDEALINTDELQATKKLDIDVIYPIIQYLNNNYKEKITISCLAKLFNTNRTSLRERFIQSTGLTPINYLIKLRIQTAIRLLEDTSIPINEIIERIGFEDMTHFRRMFKKYTGLSPSNYREKFTAPKYIIA